MDVNRIEVEGNLTKDPELKTSKNGQSFAFITVCASYPKGKAPNVEWVPEFFDVTLFGADAEEICQYAKKGSRIWVSGMMRSTIPRYKGEILEHHCQQCSCFDKTWKEGSRYYWAAASPSRTAAD